MEIFPSLAILLIVLQNLAFGKHLPWDLLPFGLGRVLWGLLSVWLVAWIVRPSFPRPETVQTQSSRRIVLIAFALGNLVFAAFSYSRLGQFGYEFPWAHLVVLAICIPWLRADRLWVSFALNLGLMLASIVHFPIHADRSDMIPVLKQGLDFWAQGLDPYSPFELSGRVNRMGYLPGTLFSQIPAWVADLDLRWNTVLYRAAWMFLVLRTVRKQNWVESRPGVIAALHFFALSPYFNFRHELYFEAFFLGFAVFVLIPRVRVWILPALILTRQWAWVMAPFLALIACSSEGRLRGRKVSQLFLSSVVSLGTVIILLRSGSFQSLWQAIFWFQGYLVKPEFPGDYGVSFSPLFFWIGHPAWIQKLQVLFCLGMFGWAVKRGLDMSRLWRFAGLTWVGFLLLNTHYWLYFWISPTLFLILASVLF